MTSTPAPARPSGRVPRPTRTLDAIVDEITQALAAYDAYRKDSAS